MARRIFTSEQIQELLKNPNVTRCSEKCITYSTTFKLGAVRKYEEGQNVSRIFEEAGFDLLVIGKDIPKQRMRLWRKIHRTKGVEGFSREMRGTAKGKGRPKTKDLTDAQRIERLEAENAYLKAENDFLAKLRRAKYGG